MKELKRTITHINIRNLPFKNNLKQSKELSKILNASLDELEDIYIKDIVIEATSNTKKI